MIIKEEKKRERKRDKKKEEGEKRFCFCLREDKLDYFYALFCS